MENPSENFCFSVSCKSMADQLGTIQGQMITAHYRKKNGEIFWRGNNPLCTIYVEGIVTGDKKECPLSAINIT